MAVAAHGEVLLARWLPPGTAGSVRVGPLPHLREVAAAAARRPGYVVVLADRDGAAVIAHTAGDLHPARHYETGARPGMQPDPHPGRPPAQHHGERHLTGREPLGGGEQNAAFTAGRVAEAAAAVSAHVILGAGDQHILDAVSKHLPGSTEFGAGDPGTGIPVPLEDGLVWAALHQDAIIVQLAERSGPLAGQPTAALLRRGAAS